MGRLTFHYSYDSEKETVTICGTDYASSNGMTLITTPHDMDEVCFEHAAEAGFVADEICNGAWNYRNQIMPGAANIFKDIARGANKALIAALEAQPRLIVRVRQPVPELPMEDYLNLCFVYRDGKFLETYDPARQYEPPDFKTTVDSVFGGTVTWALGADFANVIGSTDDPKPPGYTSWIQLWRAYFGTPASCTSLNFQGFPCTNTIFGGHIIAGQTATRVSAGSNDVYIFPICKRHNDDDSVYMETVTNRNGIWLKNYLRN